MFIFEAGNTAFLFSGANMAKKPKTEIREFLAVITKGGKQEILDVQVVRKYSLRAGMKSPFSNHPIISVMKRVPIEADTDPKKRSVSARNSSRNPKPIPKKRTVKKKAKSKAKKKKRPAARSRR